jgi:hypothetical protein
MEWMALLDKLHEVLEMRQVLEHFLVDFVKLLNVVDVQQSEMRQIVEEVFVHEFVGANVAEAELLQVGRLSEEVLA